MLEIVLAGRKIAPNTGANATKFFTLATRISKHTLTRDLLIFEDL